MIIRRLVLDLCLRGIEDLLMGMDYLLVILQILMEEEEEIRILILQLQILLLLMLQVDHYPNPHYQPARVIISQQQVNVIISFLEVKDQATSNPILTRVQLLEDRLYHLKLSSSGVKR